MRDTFKEIKKLIKDGRNVLFVGTPCQVHGLIGYVGKNRYLYTIDLLCLGVSSPKLFAEYNYLNQKYKDHVTNVQFRNKHYGYATPNVRVYFDRRKAMDQKYDTRVHANLFFRHYNVRPSCYECEFREIPRKSDFTIGNFTEIGKVNKMMDDDKGTSKLWVHSNKGIELLMKVEKFAVIHIIDEQYSNIVGGPKKQIKRPEKREQFFKDALELDYFALVSRWEPKRFKGEFAGFMRPIINKLPLKSVVFKTLRLIKLRRYNKMVQDVNKQ